MIVKKLNFYKFGERGKELKVPHHANAAAVRDGNLPYIMAILRTKKELLVLGIILYIVI